MKEKLLADIAASGRMKYQHINYPELKPTEMNNLIKELITEKKITRDIIKKKAGMHYATFVYLSLK